jgi:hypothetical protein
MLTLEFGYSRSNSYGVVVSLAKKIPGYSESGEYREAIHRLEVDVLDATSPAWWRSDLWKVFRAVSNWKGTRILRDGQGVPLGTLSGLYDSYVLAPGQLRFPWTPEGRGYFVECPIGTETEEGGEEGDCPRQEAD